MSLETKDGKDNLSIEDESIPDLFFDPLYRECINLAQKSKGAQQRYGSILINSEGMIIGMGYNRAVAHSSIGILMRVIRQGYANHAEVEAINDAIMNGYDLKDATLYVAGYFPRQDNMLFLKDHYTCTKCPPIIAGQGVAFINIPTLTGWRTISPDQALQDAQTYKPDHWTSTHEKRLLAAQGQFSLMLLKHLV